MIKLKRLCALALTSLLSITLFTGCGNSNVGVNGTIYFYNCGDYIDEDLLYEFQRETGIKVDYSTYDTNEIMYQKLKSSPGSYDLVIPSDYMIEKMIQENMVEKIDFNNIPNYEYIGDQYKNLAYDPTNEYSVPYMWGTIGIVYNPDIVTEPVNSWDILISLHDCSITILSISIIYPFDLANGMNLFGDITPSHVFHLIKASTPTNWSFSIFYS